MSTSSGNRKFYVAIIGLLIILVAVGAAFVYLVSGMQSPNAKLTTQLKEQELQALAMQHWAAIGSKNLTMLMQQYTSNAVLYWVDHPSSPLNGTYQGISAIQTTWGKFFKANPTTYYVIFNYTQTINGNTGVVNAVLWYILGGGKVTLFLPYQLIYTYSNGSWQLVSKYWGSDSSPGTFGQGIQAIP